MEIQLSSLLTAAMSGSGTIGGIYKLHLLCTQAGAAQITGSGGYGAGSGKVLWVRWPRTSWGGESQPSHRITPLQAARPSTDAPRASRADGPHRDPESRTLRLASQGRVAAW
jgi:hypothetical protein